VHTNINGIQHTGTWERA